MAESSENTFINPFVHTLRHSAQLPYSCILDLSILLIHSKPLRLSICTALTLDFSSSFHIIISLPYIRIGMNNCSGSLGGTLQSNNNKNHTSLLSTQKMKERDRKGQKLFFSLSLTPRLSKNTFKKRKNTKQREFNKYKKIKKRN